MPSTKRRERKERILVYGGPGSGKTLAWMRCVKKFGPLGATFYVIDTEIGAYNSMDEFPGIEEYIEVYECIDFDQLKAAGKEIMKLAKQGDWVVIDMADKPWALAKEHFIHKIFQQDMGDYFLEARKKMKKDSKSLYGGKDSAIKGWTDWPVITSMYEDVMTPFIYRTQAHVFLVSSGSGVSDDDSREVKELFSPFGVKPNGQKALSHQPDTVIFLAQTSRGWEWSTVKDRGGREYVDHGKLKKFEMQYGKIAGWE